jgi:hypothetical protein
MGSEVLALEDNCDARDGVDGGGVVIELFDGLTGICTYIFGKR